MEKLTRHELYEIQRHQERHENPEIEKVTIIEIRDAIRIGDEIFKKEDLTEDDVVDLALSEEEKSEWFIKSLRELKECYEKHERMKNGK